MDHHCRKIELSLTEYFFIAWINNCVGLNNHGYFLMFITYMWAATSMAIYPHSIYEMAETSNDPRVRKFITFTYF